MQGAGGGTSVEVLKLKLRTLKRGAGGDGALVLVSLMVLAPLCPSGHSVHAIRLWVTSLKSYAVGCIDVTQY